MALSADSARLGATTDRTLNKLAFGLANKADDITTATTSDRIPMVDASADYAVKYADGDNVLEMMGVTATAAELNAAADVSGRAEVVTATNVLTAAESGKTFFLDAVAGFLTTFPAPALGLEYNFIVKTAPTSNGYTFAPNGGTADIIVIGVNELEVDTSDDGPYDDNADLVTLVANVAVPGDYIHFWCDGTKWYGRGQTNADGGITSATT